MRTRLHLLALAAGLSLSGAASATLIDRGGGLIYDNVLNITWLQDANYAKTSGADYDGLMHWTDANAWAASLVYHDSVRNSDYSDWRLPTIVDTSTTGCNWAYSGTDCGYNVQTVSGSMVYSEMAYMYYVNLGLKGYIDTSGSYQSGSGIFGNGTTSGQKDIGLIDNLQAWAYWPSLEYAHSYAWYFGMGYGDQNWQVQYADFYAWAVRNGDVTTAPTLSNVPEPATLLLLGLGMAGLALARRRG